MAYTESVRPLGLPLAASARRTPLPEVFVRVDDAGPLREIVLDRRGRRNALTLGMYEALTAAIAEASSSPRVDVIVLSSAGGAFCVGSDRTESDAAEFARAAAEYARALAHCPKIIVAVVNGLAAGIGAATLLHCDFVIVSESAAIEFSSVKGGHIPDAGLSVLLPARVGHTMASELLLVGERIDPKTALRLGLVTAVAGFDDLPRSGRARAEALMRLPQESLREAKHLLREPLMATIDAAIDRELVAALALAAKGPATPSAPHR